MTKRIVLCDVPSNFSGPGPLKSFEPSCVFGRPDEGCVMLNLLLAESGGE